MSTENYPRIYLYKRIVQAKLFIDSHFAENIDLDNISDEAYFSKFHFIRLFKKIYGKTPHQYLIFVRIENATKLIRNGITVSETCHTVGFESLSSFSGLFKRMVGKTPSDYFAEQQYLKKEMLQTPLKFIPNCYVSQHGLSKK